MPEKNKAEKIKTAEQAVEETVEEVADEKTDGETTEEAVVDESAEKIQKLETEVSEWKDKYMRLAAEYDNYRKRTANEKLSLYDDATAKAVAELLPVADSMQMALANLKDAAPEILKGIELVSNQLDKSFEKLKVSGYGEVGDTFDPNIHNAISKVESEELGENTIAGVFQKGYKIGEKIIRHAMVQVANCD
jgi:molecular chaperone GrpE